MIGFGFRRATAVAAVGVALLGVVLSGRLHAETATEPVGNVAVAPGA